MSLWLPSNAELPVTVEDRDDSITGADRPEIGLGTGYHADLHNKSNRGLRTIRDLYGKRVVLDTYDATGGTDYTQALRDAIDDAVAQAQADGSNVAEVLAYPKTYTFGGALQQGGARKANAQIPLPYIDPAVSKKMTLMIRCPAVPGAPWATGGQTSNQRTGCVFQSTLAGATYSATYGIPSFIGGPTHVQAGSSEFSNILIGMDGIRVVLPANPSITGLDFSHLSQMECGWLAIEALYDAWVFGIGPNVTAPTSVHNYGIIAPAVNNNAWCNIDRLSIIGMYAGLCFSEHCDVKMGGILSCRTAMSPLWGDAGGHSSSINHMVIEKCRHIIASSNPASGGIVGAGGASHRCRMDFFHVEIEDTNQSQIGAWNEPGHEHLIDPSNLWQGYFRFMRTSPGGTPSEPTTISKLGATALNAPSLR